MKVMRIMCIWLTCMMIVLAEESNAVNFTGSHSRKFDECVV